jgi:RNA polymerase sigma-70 factor (ECF subfamily)
MQVPIDPNEELASLAQRAASRDATAFEELVMRCQADMARLCFAVCGDLDLAHDAVQSAWATAWARLTTLRDPAAVRSWLLAIAANEARRTLRRDRLRGLAQLRARRTPLPEESMHDLDLERALRILGAADRELLGLRYGLGMDSSEIAKQLGIGASGVRMRLARALARLRRELDQ